MRNFLKSTHPSPSLAPETAQTSLGRRILGAITGSPDRKFSGLHSPPSGAASPALSANRRPFLPIIVALMAALAVGMSLWLSGALVHAQSAQMVIEYPENGTGPVVTFTAVDPEGLPIVWSFLDDSAENEQDLGIFTDGDGDGVDDTLDDVELGDFEDFVYFNISTDGVLTFKRSPDFEAPFGVEGDNDYRVVVQASDGGLTNERSWFKVTVTVTDEEEQGKVTWTVDPDGFDPGADETHAPGMPDVLLQFQPGASLEAMATDGDASIAAPVSNVRWQWYRSSSKTAMGTRIDGATSATYTVSDTSGSNDVGMYLRATATYSDSRGPNKNAYLVSEYPVQLARDDNTVPTFALTNQTREIRENSTGSFGAPMAATDADRDVLNYSRTTVDDDGDAGLDNAKFEVDQKTGQLSVARGITLNFEDATDLGTSHPDPDVDGEVEDNVYEVKIKATDSSGDDSAVVTVHITVTDENEKPVFGSAAAGPPLENAMGPAADHAEEGVGNTGDDYTQDIAVYSAYNPEGGNVEFSVMGADGDKFELNAVPDDECPDITDKTGTVFCKMLAFEGKPDFEARGDSNSDNIYEVTVRASDGEMYQDRKVTVKVIDSAELGKVELSSQDALIGVELTATLTDSDGGVPTSGTFTDIKWTWYSLGMVGEDPGDTNAISKATSNTYTPVVGDKGRFLTARVSYTDRTRDENIVDPPVVGFTNTATSDPTTAVRNNPLNQRPTFVDGARTARVVEENTKALAGAENAGDADDDALAADNPADNVGGGPVMATDDDGDNPTYTLSGSDADMFRVRADGQIEVSDKAMLDYETRRSHTITVKADDGYGASNSIASITVTINVTNVDESPTINDKADSTAEGEQAVSYAEGETVPVISLSAVDPEGLPIVWSFLDDSAENEQDLGIFTDGDGNGVDDTLDDVELGDFEDFVYFNISTDGVLTFKRSPDFEAPFGVDGDNDYRVVVQASDGGLTNERSWFKVTVTVTDEEEQGKVTWDVDPDGDGGDKPVQKLRQFNTNARLIASTPTDDDGPVMAVRWQWYRSTSKTAMGTAIAGATTAMYDVMDTPADANDVGKYLRVVATYNDGAPDKTAYFVSEYPVQAVRESGNQMPTFASTSQARRIKENSTGSIGAPVRATDADNGDVLNYLKATVDDDGGVGLDNAKFEVDQKTGQLSVARGITLNFEDATDLGTSHPDPDVDGEVEDNIYEVKIKATDSFGDDSAVVTVHITVTDENEKPVFGSAAAGPPLENAMGPAADHAEEGVGNTGDDYTQDIAVYSAYNPEGGNVEFSVMGADGDKFELNAVPDDECPDITDKTGTVFCKMLAFEGKPDFEARGDSNSDNIYEVTVRASDGGMYQDRKVTVKVIDSAELGKVELSSQDALIGVELTATLTDSDGGVPTSGTFTDIKWTWYSLGMVGEDPGDTNAISKATSNTYTPVVGDRGRFLTARVSYTDRTRDENIVDPPVVGFTNTATSDPTTGVRDNPLNQRPTFVEDARTARVVEENTKALAGAENAGDADDDALAADNPADNVGGGPVMATDDDGEDTLTYTLSGTDEDSFRVRQNGQIEVSDKAMLDYETKDEYTVIVTATDSSTEANNTASITVTIHVTDLDESPVLASGGLAVTGPSAISYAEGSTGPVATYTASGADAATARWTLSGVDADDFSLTTSGRMHTLAFKTPPDFGSPADADFDNDYRVTIEANDGENQATLDVTVSVTDVAEPNTPPVFSARLATRSVAEGTAAGGNVGAPVVATDADGDTLTYTLSGTDEPSFEIGITTGQITVGAGTTLDSATKATYNVTVEAEDQDRAKATIVVTITVTAEDTGVVTPPVVDDTSLFTRYDTDDSGTFDREETIAAITDFLLGTNPITRAEVIRIITLFLLS